MSSERPLESGSRSGPSTTGGHRAALALGVVDNYEIVDELGSGGMATVYRAIDTRLQRAVALKILHDHIAGRPENRERFEREARAVARLKHPNIMSVYGFSSPSAPVGYIAAELIDGETLRAFVDRRGFGLPEIAGMVCVGLAHALEHAHAAGIIHRDIKPENVMLGRDGGAKLMDFGLARILDHQTLTATGAVLGSPAHMSPETIEGHVVDERVDIFAFGTVLYFAATRRLPFDGRNPAVILNAILVGEYADPVMVNPRVGARLARIIERCLETAPADRYQTVRELRTDLEAWLGSLGIEDFTSELAQFSADPDAYETALEQRIVEHLEQLADAAVAAGRMGSGLAYCDQLLALRASNPAALRILGRVERHRRRGVLLRAVGSLVVLASLAAVAWLMVVPWIRSVEDVAVDWVATDGDEVGTATAVVARAVAVSASELPEPEAPDVGAVVASAAAAAELSGLRAGAVAQQIANRNAMTVRIPPRRPPPRTDTTPDTTAAVDAPDAAPEVELFPVIFRIWPPTAMVRINGVERGRAVDLGDDIRLPVGVHTIEMNVPGLQRARLTQTFRVSAGGRNTFPFRVPLAPGYIQVVSRSDGHAVVDGRVFSTRDAIEVEMAGGGTERTIEVELLPPNGAPTRTHVVVRTEQTVPVMAPF